MSPMYLNMIPTEKVAIKYNNFFSTYNSESHFHILLGSSHLSHGRYFYLYQYLNIETNIL